MSEIKDQFKKHIKNHKMSILKDDGEYRHIIMSDKSPYYHYEIITWPNYLCFCGDMGTFVFSRLPDMFNFFRQENKEPEINPGYWKEKLQAQDMSGGAEEYSSELFTKIIKEIVDQYIYDNELSEEEGKELLDEVESEVLWYSEEEGKAREVAGEFDYKGLKFDDLWERDFRDYTYRYIWCLYAIVHTISLYDNFKNNLKKDVDKEIEN